MHQSTGYIDLHADALRLTLVEGNLESTFHVFAVEEVVLAGVRIRATIIGSSHVVTYDTGSFTLHEIFACEALPNISSWTMHQLSRSPVRRQLTGAQYEFSVTSVDWSDPEPDALVALAAAAQHPAPDRLGVSQDFPKGEHAVTPKTVIVGAAGKAGKELVVQTAHSYPQDRALILSRSVLTVA